MGRNIWQSEHPAAMIQAIHGIVKNRLNVKEALELYDDVKTKIIDRLLHLNKCKINIYHIRKSPYVTYGLLHFLLFQIWLGLYRSRTFQTISPRSPNVL